MSNLSFFLTDNITDPRSEGLPCFGIGYGTGNTIQSFRVFNSDFNVINNPYTGILNTNTSYRHGMALDQFYMYSLSDFVDTEAQLSTQASTSADWFQSLHQNDQYPMAMWTDCSPLGYRRGVNLNRGSFATIGKFKQGIFLISQVLPAGVRPRRYFSINQTVMYESFSLNSLNGTDDRLDIQSYRPAGANTNADCQGAAGYNERTKTLVVTFGTTSTSTQINVFKSTVDLNSCEKLADFFDNATATGFTITRGNYQATDNRYSRTVTVGDNDFVFMSYRSGNNQHADLIDLTAQTSTVLTTVNGTTSYGPAQGPEYYVKTQSTWDSVWETQFSPYSQYGNGAMGYVISTEDPRRYFTFTFTDTSGGGAVMPIGESKFMQFVGTNTNGEGVPCRLIDLSNTSTQGTAATTIATHAGVAAINNGGAINTTSKSISMHGGYYSTCYPRFFTINWWPINGKFNYEGAVR